MFATFNVEKILIITYTYIVKALCEHKGIIIIKFNQTKDSKEFLRFNELSFVG